MISQRDFTKRDSGLVVPKGQPQARNIQDFPQRDLIADQLPRYLIYLLESGAIIEAVYRQSSGATGRYCVAYRHHEKLDTEIYT